MLKVDGRNDNKVGSDTLMMWIFYADEKNIYVEAFSDSYAQTLGSGNPPREWAEQGVKTV